MNILYNSAEDTMKHIKQIRLFLDTLEEALFSRGQHHDNSKLQEPEKSMFDEYTPKLATLTYGTAEYKQTLDEMRPALVHHYANNRHHPEFHGNGIKDMNLIDLCEMICDWKAATMRHNDEDIMKSIEFNQKRFGYGDEVKQILINTVEDYLTKGVWNINV